MEAKTKVAIVGATGMTGSSITRALLADADRFHVIALARPASVGKDENVELEKAGVTVKPVELAGSLDILAQELAGMDVVISCMTLLSLKEEMNLIHAASKANVGRYVPSFFGPCCPPRHVMLAREMKEDLLNHIKLLYLPYTVIDIGWWYQLSLPPLPSGRIQSKFEYSATQIVGDGNTPWALTDNRDIGKYVSRIIIDPRTLNKSVFGYSEVRTQNEVWDVLERLSGETVSRQRISKEYLERVITEGQEDHDKMGPDRAVMYKLGMAQYKNLLGIRGDNTPEHAKYLGYLDVKELYPEVESTPLEDFVSDMLGQRLKPLYS